MKRILVNAAVIATTFAFALIALPANAYPMWGNSYGYGYGGQPSFLTTLFGGGSPYMGAGYYNGYNRYNGYGRYRRMGCGGGMGYGGMGMGYGYGWHHHHHHRGYWR